MAPAEITYVLFDDGEPLDVISLLADPLLAPTVEFAWPLPCDYDPPPSLDWPYPLD
jgi:hypothetical protein